MLPNNPNQAKRKHDNHLRRANQFLKHLTKENEEKDPEQYFTDVMSCRSLAQQAYAFKQSNKAKNLLKILDTK